MKPILVLILIVAPWLSSFCQDYQTFSSNSVHYFKEVTTGNILASEIIDFEVELLDTILFPFLSIKEQDSGYLKDIPSWMGAKIVIKSDGTNLFFNEAGDTITIETQSNLGESFTMYTFPSGVTIEATVDTIIESTFYGITDSVKVLSFDSSEPGFILGDNQFRIGKNLGLIDIYPFYSFPEIYTPLGRVAGAGISKYTLVGQLYPRLGITKATHYDLNSLNIGDVIGYKGYYDYLYEHTYRKKVIDKIETGEMATYTFELYTETKYSGTSEEDPPTLTYTTDIITETYNISHNFINTYLIPEKNYEFGSSDKVIGIKHSNSCGFTERSYTLGSTYVGGGNYYHTHHYHSSYFFNSGGLNQDYYIYHFDDGHDSENHGEYYQSSSIDGYICGNGEFLELPKMAVKKEEISIYPNPSQGEQYLEILVSTEVESNIEILNSQGKKVLDVFDGSLSPNINNKMKIELGDLPNGIYFCMINLNGKSYQKKIIKI
ncbi:MAG: T9SS type A sorting domain-containing protein [Crocinitomix sp.]|nr:T9SS type A sorting domain-containing protein [Crocinitomix sp.]